MQAYILLLLADSWDIPVGWIPAGLLDRPLVPGEYVFLAEEGNHHATQQGNSNESRLHISLESAGNGKLAGLQGMVRVDTSVNNDVDTEEVVSGISLLTSTVADSIL